MIPDLGDDGIGETTDHYDARAIADMATGMKHGYAPPTILSGWHRLEVHPVTGTWLTWPWENPTAWGILDGDVDRVWFMRSITEHLDLLTAEAARL